MKFKDAIPIFYSADVIRSLDYYTEILGFESRWDWGDPPTFGGVGKDNAQIFFCENGQGNPGTWLSLFVDNVDEFYDTVKAKGARILSPPQTMEWGVREMLVADPDGHKIRVGQNAHMRDQNQAATLSSTISIHRRIPTAAEYLGLVTAVGWLSSMNIAMEEKLLAAALFAVVAEDTVSGKTIGCALLLGDDASFYYVKDVMVHPDWQHRRVGTALMQELTHWLDTAGADKALVGLYTGDGLAPFYDKFGFRPAFGMSRRVHRNEKNK